MKKKSILIKLENLRAEFKDHIIERELYCLYESEEWQESEAGENYLEGTELINGVLNGLDMAIEDFKEFLEL